MRVKITMACTECKQRNYNTKKNKKNTPDRMEMNKYSSRLVSFNIFSTFLIMFIDNIHYPVF